MFDKFTELAEANVDHFNDHPVAHTAIAVVGLVGSVVLARKLAKRIAGTPSTTVVPMPK
jgi:hypothetical protein